MADRKYYVICDAGCRFESMTKEQILAAIAEVTGSTPTAIDDAFITKIKETNKGKALKFWVGTEAEYNALIEIDPDTHYIKTNDSKIESIERALNNLGNAAYKDVGTGADNVATGNHAHPELLPLFGNGDPSSTLTPVVGQFYIDLSGSVLWYCSQIISIGNNTSYVWAKPNTTLVLNGAPTTKTSGNGGQFALDSTTGNVYICTGYESGSYTWVQINGSSEGGEGYVKAEDLGDAAYKDVGTGSNNVAAGNHTHNYAPAYSPVSNISASKTLALADAQKLTVVNSTSDVTITIPAYANVSLLTGTEIEICRFGTGGVIIKPATSAVVINGKAGTSNTFAIAEQYGTVALKKIATNTWILSGCFE